jgi:predicted CopG family antitoxin
MVRTTVKDEAHAEVVRRKKHTRDSIAKVTLRLAGRRRTPLKAAGTWKDMMDAEAAALLEQSHFDFETIGAGR